MARDLFTEAFHRRSVRHDLHIVDDALSTFWSEHWFTLEAVLPARFFGRHYQWTGSGGFEAPELECGVDEWGHPHHRIHGPVVTEGLWRTVLIDLGRTLDVGEKEVVRLRHRGMYDYERTFSRKLTHFVQGGTERVELRVTLPDSLASNVSYFESDADGMAVAEPIRLKGESVQAGRQEFKVEKSSVSIGHTYGIRV